MKYDNNIKAVIAGNPNCGKTTLFNYLTKSNQHTGNWSGVTVEKKYGYVHNTGKIKIELIDLPGTYSLYPYSPEEKIALKSIFGDKPDVIINIVDSTNLERNLYLTTQLLELDIPVVIAFNMYDVLKKRGDFIDIKVLSNKLNAPIIPISAKKGSGIKSLIDTTIAAATKKHKKTELRLHRNNDMKIANARYNFIFSAIKSATHQSNRKEYLRLSKRIDKILTNRILAIPIFIFIMALIFYITFGPFGQSLKYCTEYIISDIFENFVKYLLDILNISDLLQSLILDGIISGVGSIIAFLPQIALLFMLLSLLEDSGYMARGIFITDKIFRSIGLSGKSFVPVLMGFGCSVPAILSTRTLDNKNEKHIALLITPFMSCSAKMPVYMLIASTFFKAHYALVIFMIYMLGIAVAVLTAVIFKNNKSNKPTPFIMELAPYRIPSFKSIALLTMERVKEFLTKTSTVILLSSVILWLLQNYNFQFQPTSSDDSIISLLGRLIAPAFYFCGFDNWQAGVSLLAGIPAKEGVASTLCVLCSSNGLHSIFTPISAFSFLCFVLLYPTCIGATVAIYKETKSFKKTAFSVFYQIFIAFFVSSFVYQFATLAGNLFA